MVRLKNSKEPQSLHMLPCKWLLAMLFAHSTGIALNAAPALHFQHLTVDDGLTDNQAIDLVQDHHGFIWIATANGLNRFDGVEVRQFLHDRDRAGSLPHNDVRALAVDGRGRLWVGTRGGGLSRFDPAQERFVVHRKGDGSPCTLGSDFVNVIIPDGKRGLFLGTRTDGFIHFDFDTGCFTNHRASESAQGALRGNRIDALAQTADGAVWIAGYGHGVYRFDPTAQRFERFAPVGGKPDSLPDARATSLLVDRQDRLWIGSEGGLSLWLPKARHFRNVAAPILAGNMIRDIAQTADGHLWLSVAGVGLQEIDPDTLVATEANAAVATVAGAIHRPLSRRSASLADAATGRLMIDRGGVLFVATARGVDRLDPATRAFRAYAQDETPPIGFPDDNLWGIDQTADGAIWMATASAGVLRFDPATRRYSQWQHDPASTTSIGSNRTYALLVDSKDRVFVGTPDAGLQWYDPERDRWRRFVHDPKDPASLANNMVYSIREAPNGDLLLGLNHGVDRFDPESGRFTHPTMNPADPEGGMTATVFDVIEDKDGTLWMATFLNGLYELRQGTFEFRAHQPTTATGSGSARGLGSLRVNVLLLDPTDRLYAGTPLGLFRHDGPDNQWTPVAVQPGEVGVSVASLFSDPAGDIWIGTPHGLKRYDPETGAVRRWLASDGLPSSEMAWHGLAGLDGGGIAIATGAGFALLDPAALEHRGIDIPIVLTGMELFNRPVRLAGDVATAIADEDMLLAQSITETDTLALTHRQSMLTLSFAGLDFARPGELRYQYRLQGFDPDWLDTPARRRMATYTNLPPGTYRFHARAARRGGEFGPPGTPMTITVSPPPWRTGWAYALYALIVGLACFAVVRQLLRREQIQRQRAEREASINERLRRVDQLREEFLANTSHELRTPLHGIIGLAESMNDGASGTLSANARQNLDLIIASGRRLSAMVNDILDFSSLKHDSLSLVQQPVDLRPLVDIVLALSQPLVGHKPIMLRNEVGADLPMAHADEARVLQILHNLVGNAIKFTEAGAVVVDATINDRMLMVSVRDTGIGIAETDQARIFESFEQADGGITRRHGGTGLGLAIARQLVVLHGGTITVVSRPGEGAQFQFTLPMSKEATRAPDAVHPVDARIDSGAAAMPASRTSDADDGDAKPTPTRDFTILVVEDDPINRRVLMNHLALDGYRLLEAADGAEALDRVREESPDLLLLDVMMPRLSGFDVCRKLREELPATRMPVIYLTARAQVVDIVAGFDSGANDYLAKPVARAELLARVRTQLELLDATRNLERKVHERTEALREANAALELLATLDGLTRIANRRSFDRALDEAWTRHLDSQGYLSLLMFDIDAFKRFNDHYGHPRGDDVLIRVAQAATKLARGQGQLAARYGGEEFVLLLPGTEAGAARSMAEALLEAVRDLRLPHATSDTAPIVTISIGVASVVPEPHRSPEWLIEQADQALYRAKHAGRNRVIGPE